MKTKKIAAIAGALILLAGVTTGCSSDEPTPTETPAATETAAPEQTVSAEDRQELAAARAALSSAVMQANVTRFVVDGRIDEAVFTEFTDAIANAEATLESARGAEDIAADIAELTSATEALESAREAAEAAREG